MTFDVPIVDISSYTGGSDATDRRATAQAMDAACRRVGFVQVVGHGVPAHATAGLASAIDDFFALGASEKRTYRSAGTNRGYTPPKAEALSLSAGVAPANRMKDFFEAFNVGTSAADHPDLGLPADHYAPNVWPTGLPAFEPAVRTYFRQAQRVARTLTTIFADALALPPSYFRTFTDHSIEVLRLNNYALPPGEIELDADLTGMGEHTDFGIVTVLWADRIPGLQVLGHDGSWHDVMPAPGALLVNLGDLMARWTDDHWVSTLHRVKPPVVDGRILRRRSAAFFHDGNSDAIIRPLGDGSSYPPISVDEHIAAKLRGSRGGVLNTAADREAHRIRTAVTR
ncbi:isopenicillin N synthase family dioxygenase [Cryptosporangium phraense]|uniref:Isopenicillin N synthase family oxygenase n=1 Tax=Cryptosporangium phraense TaxID=2593070 RepID=A0A545AX22_9ACTN|nr:2-oxoglutarate and iron-dependent oxygenase domain-containing protein [Cryptosporangium phraense]TQS45874.1 isopenicillin N synthase family oxygenase [Cryptosporangium phraense]